jgi:predicted phosphodiesterase
MNSKIEIHSERNSSFLLLRSISFVFLLCIFSTAASQQLLVSPYLQPGNASTLSKEEKVLIWQTDSVPGNYKIEYLKGPFTGDAETSRAKISFIKLFLNNKTTFLYRARLSKLQFDELYSYRLSLNGKSILENSFISRSKKSTVRFAVFGDCGSGTQAQAQIAYQVHKQKPQFVLVTGDNVYSNGTEREYRKNFFPYYLAPEASPEKGAPLMNTIPFYMVVGNHDVRGADLDKFPDGLAYFYYNDLPFNAPVPKLTVKASGNADRIKTFRKNAGGRFPRMTNFSYDYGNVHIVCLDANLYANPLDPFLVEWLKRDLKQSKADWKIVAYHHPGFNSSKAHYNDQQMRLLSRLLEELGVDLVLTGHVHNYQRSLPLKFSPKKNEDATQYIISPEGRVDGVFTLDQQFDGITNTKPNGIIYIVTGAGGAPLYDKELTGNPALWKHDPAENWAPFTMKMISDKHSFTLIETREKKLNLKQMDVNGEVLDEITLTK